MSKDEEKMHEENFNLNIFFFFYIRIPTVSAQKEMKCKVSHRLVDELLILDRSWCKKMVNPVEV